MYLYLELWKAKDEWRALTEVERETFVGGLAPSISKLTEQGVELIGFSFNDEDVIHRADFTYMAAWRMPSKDLALQMEHLVNDAGFYHYFEQINARGEVSPPETVLLDMAKG